MKLPKTIFFLQNTFEYEVKQINGDSNKQTENSQTPNPSHSSYHHKKWISFSFQSYMANHSS